MSFWSAIPERKRSERRLVELVDIVHGASDGATAIAMLFQQLKQDPVAMLTLLHEIGHHLGWDEEELEARGLG